MSEPTAIASHAASPDGAEYFSGVVEPGNGTRYDWAMWKRAGQWYFALPDFHRSSRIGSGRHDRSYVADKLRLSNPDAEVVAGIINGVFRHRMERA